MLIFGFLLTDHPAQKAATAGKLLLNASVQDPEGMSEEFNNAGSIFDLPLEQKKHLIWPK